MIVIMSLQAFSTWAWADGVRPARLRSRLARSRERERAERRKQRDGAAVSVLVPSRRALGGGRSALARRRRRSGAMRVGRSSAAMADGLRDLHVLMAGSSGGPRRDGRGFLLV